MQTIKGHVPSISSLYFFNLKYHVQQLLGFGDGRAKDENKSWTKYIKSFHANSPRVFPTDVLDFDEI